MNSRAIAMQIILEVIQHGRSLSDAMTQQFFKNNIQRINSQDRSFIQALCYGVMRWYFQLEAISKNLLQKPLKIKDTDVYILILIGIYQLMHMRIPDYAAVGETVAAVNVIKKKWAKNLVNGVLRAYQRTAENINSKVQYAYYSHPEWMMKKIKMHWPDRWQQILEANNEHPPLSLRINQKMISREDYGNLLVDKAIEFICIPETTSGIILKDPVDIISLPGFAEGYFSVQDGAAQLAAELLQLAPGQSVLDACAAPGGKTTHILETQSQLKNVTAVDCDAQRIELVKENLQRLALSAKCLIADVGNTETWWDKTKFDRILLDAPCSASGVIRRHPDIKFLRRETDVIELVKQQTRLLTQLWQTLKPGGILLYATCSIFSEENEGVIQAFLNTHDNAIEDKFEASWGCERSYGRQILPGMHRMDGFYYARLQKK